MSFISIASGTKTPGWSQMRSRSDASRKRFMDTMNRAVNVLWRVTNPWDSWKDKALVRLGYDQLDAAQQSKDADIWQAVLKLYYLTLFRLPGSDYANLQKLPKERVHERNALIKGEGEGADPDEFYLQKNSEGYHFVGVTTASGKGIAADQIPAAKNALRQGFRNIMAHKGITDPSKIIITSGGTGNWDPGTLSGVDLVYEVAEEMGFKTMSVFPTDAFRLNFPIRATDFYLHAGEKFGQESIRFYQFTDSLVTMAGGDQAYTETLAEIPQLIEKGGIAYLIQGIETQKVNKATGLKVAATDALEIRSSILAKGPNGSVVTKVVDREVVAVDELNVRFSGVSRDGSGKQRFINPDGLRPVRSFDELEPNGVVRAEIRPEDVLKTLKAPSQIRAALEAKGAAIV